VAALDAAVTGLGKRQFLLQSAHRDNPVIFATRWAMSYLRGPLTRDQVAELMRGHPDMPALQAPVAPRVAPAGSLGAETAAAVGAVPAAPSASRIGAELRPDESAVAPSVAAGVPERFLEPSAPWAKDIGADPRGLRLEAALAARVFMRFDDATAGVDHNEEWEAVFFPLEPELDPRAGKAVDYDGRDFRDSPPEGVLYAIPRAPIDRSGFFDGAERAIRDALYQDRSLQVHRNLALRLYGRVGESREDFARRCDDAAEAAADRETAALRSRYEDRLARARDKLDKAENRLDEVRTDLDSRKRTEMFAGAGDLLSALLGGRGRTRSLVRSVSRGASRRSLTERTGQRVVTAQEQVESYTEDIGEIEAELAEVVAEIDGRWREKATAIETIGIGLEKSDVTVSELALVWVPVTSGHRVGA
jgi:hypothetical protein